MRMCAALLVVLASCRAGEPVAEPQVAAPTTAAPMTEPVSASTPAPVASPKRDIIVRNAGPTECKISVQVGIGLPSDDVEGDTLRVGTTTIPMTKEEGLALRSAEGSWGTSGRSDGDHGEILIHPGCAGLSVSDDGFAPQHVAMLWPHTVGVCCKACDPKGCTDCTETKPGARCKSKQSIAGKCALFEDVLDCVPATAVDDKGVVGGEYGPMHRLSQPSRAAPAK